MRLLSCENKYVFFVQKLSPPPKPKNSNKEKEFPTEITLSLRYLPYCEGLTASKLVIGIEVHIFINRIRSFIYTYVYASQ
jgi:hypothetical protein